MSKNDFIDSVPFSPSSGVKPCIELLYAKIKIYIVDDKDRRRMVHTDHLHQNHAFCICKG